jgi:hypothetical protein
MAVPRLSEEQIAEAKSVDILSYLQNHEPGNLKKVGADRYVLKDHDSFVISNGKFFWNSQNIGGHGALDYLIKVKGLDFVSAVNSLTNSYAVSTAQSSNSIKRQSAPSKQEPEKIKRLSLPKANYGNTKAASYLMSRGISKSTVWRCINMGLMYESVNKTCVFLGKDGNIPKYACERSIYGDIKKDVYGSDKRFGFCMPPERPEKSVNLAVFESPIDALAHYDLIKMTGGDWDGHRLSLGGVSSVALNSFLERNPNIAHIYLCLDADKAGQEAAQRIKKELSADKRTAGIKVTVSPPVVGKDYGEMLQSKLHTDKQHERAGRQKQAAVSI